MKLHYFHYSIHKKDEGRQIKSVLTRVLGFSTAKVRSAKFDPAGILLDGERAPVTRTVTAGQTLSILLNDSEHKDANLVPTPMALSVLYEDEDLIILDKPAGMVCHPSKGHVTDSLASGVLAYFQEQGDTRSNIHLIGRLDKDTTGVVTIAKNSAAADFLALERERGEWAKTYYCLVEGELLSPGSRGDITIPMEEYRDENGNLKMREAQAGGLSAITHYEIIRITDHTTLCRVRIETGRTHQIRFHMAAIGHPLIGDALYGKPSSDLGHAALYAESVRLIQPFTGKALEIHSRLCPF